MRSYRHLSVFALHAACAALLFTRPALAAPSDAQIRAAEVGEWGVPPDSTDLTDDNRYAHETVRADGTVTTYFYGGPHCTQLRRAIDQHWWVKDGLETSVVDASGFTMHDRVVGFDARHMTFHSLDDGTTYTRVRVEPCGRPVS